MIKIPSVQQCITVLLAFSLGWLASTTALNAAPVVEQAQETIAIFSDAADVPSPADVLTMDKIHVLQNRVEIDQPGVIPAVFADTNSMDPVFDTESTALELMVTSTSQVQVGDIVSYETPLAPGAAIVHRIVEIGTDEQGWFAIMKGDNLPTTDPGKVRASQLRRKVIGILY